MSFWFPEVDEVFLILLFFKTLLFRWYVFFFLFLGFWLLSRQVGKVGAGLRFLTSFAASYFCEWSSSLPNGWFPFGHYTYLPTTRAKELWVGHLPFMDFLSFSFLMVGSLGIVSRVWGVSVGEVLRQPLKITWPLFLLSDLMFFGVDMVIDPVSLRGNRWFLGQIYYYPQGGIYFGVPLANFAGWAVLGGIILFLWRALGRLTPLLDVDKNSSRSYSPIDCWGPSFLWLSVYLFNFGIALYLEKYFLCASDLIVLLILFLMLFFVKKNSGNLFSH